VSTNRETLNILLVYPSYPDTFWSFGYSLKFISKKAVSPPIGLLTVAALLPKTWKKKVVDLNVDSLKEEDIQWADYVFLSAMEIQQKSVQEVIIKVKDYGKKIVAGGPLFTITPDRVQNVDHLVLQEAEATLPCFIEDLRRGKEKPVYTSTEWPDITSSPIPQWDLIDISKYAVMSVQYSRGCPFDCEFCHIGLLNGRRPRTKTGLQILAELETLYQKGGRGTLFFVDDNFIGQPRRLKEELLPALIKWMEGKKYPFSFFTQASMNLVDDEELMELMVKAGFDSVFVGIETPEEKSLYECEKVQNKQRDMIAAVKKMQSFGLEVLGGFIVGFDSDPPSIFHKQIDFIQESGIVTAMVGLLNAPRGTRLYNRLQQEGRLLGDFAGEYTSFSTNFIPKMGTHRLQEGYKYLINFIYSPRHFYRRLITFLSNYCPPDNQGSRIKSYHIKAFLHSIWSLGVWGEERFCYWKVLFWTLLRKPKLLRWCVELAMKGYHFRKVFEDHIYKEGLPVCRPTWVLPSKLHEDQFDSEHCKKVAPEIERMISKSYRSIVFSEESKKRILELATSSIIYASLHWSHFDYIAICGKMFLEGLPCPRTIAGGNLLKGMMGWSIKQLTGIDMMKWGAVPFERDSSGPRNLLTLCGSIEAFLRSDKPVLAFPEMETSSNGKRKSIRTGRAYGGKIGKFASSFFSAPIHVSKEGKKVYIVPVAVSYHFVAEDSYFPRLIKADKMRKSDDSLVSFAGKLYYTLLEIHFFCNIFRLGKGNIYIDIGRPIFVEPNASKQELAQRAQQEAARCSRITMLALVCYAIGKGATTNDELQKSVQGYASILKEAEANFQPSSGLRGGVEAALQDLAQRKIISNNDGILVRKPEIINYYANTIAHHFERF
jgi:radical SAM superfamily enzyme YgiQ (UPF0313 family)/1-acyl-sn-glycerol-3-phosphate acyltransferase